MAGSRKVLNSQPEFSWGFSELCPLSAGDGSMRVLPRIPHSLCSSSHTIGSRVSGRTMAKGETSKCNHCLNPGFIILLSYLGTTWSDGVFSGSTWRGWVTEHGPGLN